MKEQFDKRLVEKIRDSFENYEESFDPIEWSKFSQAYFNKPAKHRKFAYWTLWISGVAASLVLGILFFPFESEIEQGVSTIKDKIATKSKSLDYISKPNESLNVIDNTDKQVVETLAYSETKKENTEVIKESGTSRFKHEPILLEKAVSMNEEIGFVDPDRHLKKPNVTISARDQDGSKEQATALANENTESMDSESAKAWVEEWKNGAENGKSKKGAETIIKKEKAQNPFRLGLVAGPQSASNPVSGVQLGGGLMSEFSLNDRLKLDVGVTYARQSIEPETRNKLPEAMTMRAANAVGGSSVTNDYLGSEYTFSYSGFDIPINLKYKVMDNSKSDIYLITGLSSMVYLEQTGRETFSVESKFSADFAGALQFTESVQQYTEEYSPSEGQSNVDLGKMLNLSFGYEYNLKNGTFLSIEPYYKLPLGDMTFTNQQFSIGGLNLRMNFQFKK